MKRALFLGCLVMLFCMVITENIVFADLTTVKPRFKVWKTIMVGTHKTVDSLRKDVKAGGSTIRYQYTTVSMTDDELRERYPFTDIFDDYAKMSSVKKKINLVVLSVSDLGFSRGASLKQIYDRARALKLDFCSWETVMQLRLQYKRQPKGEFLRIAAEPNDCGIGSSHEVVNLPIVTGGYSDDYVRYGKDLVVTTRISYDGSYYLKNCLFVFTCNK